MLTLHLLQLGLPLALLALLVFAPPRSMMGWLVQALATSAVVLALGYAGIWTFPPWWARYVYAGLLVAAVLSFPVRQRHSARWPHRPLGWLHLVGFATLGIYGATIFQGALAGTVMPLGQAIDLSSPFERGTYLVANGGSATSVNAHAAFLDRSIIRRRAYYGTGHGVDLIALDRWGLRVDGILPADPRRYVIFSKPVVAPCDGSIIVAVDGLPDMPVPQVDRAHLAGNHVLLRCASVDVLLGHFQKGSVGVRVGQVLRVGDPVARVGNSGNSSEPHLHIHAQKPGTREAPFSGAPIPIRIEGRYLVRNDRLEVPTPQLRP